MTTAFDFAATRLDGTEQPLSDYRGEVLLIVNVASKCGFTPQYAGLQALHERFHGRGFEVLGFPCDQFGGQEPGGPDEIAAFCATTYGIGFPMFAKVEVNGPAAHPLFAFLKRARKGLLGSEAIKWNFTKFLVARDGAVAARHAPATRPQALEREIERLLTG